MTKDKPTALEQEFNTALANATADKSCTVETLEAIFADKKFASLAKKPLFGGKATYDAAIGGQALVNTIYKDKKDLVGFLLEKGVSATADTSNTGFTTPLATAIYHSKFDIADVLIAKGAPLKPECDINAKNPFSNALFTAFVLNDEKTIDYLSSKGINPNEQDKQGNTIADKVIQSSRKKDDLSQSSKIEGWLEEKKALLNQKGAITGEEARDAAPKTFSEIMSNALIRARRMLSTGSGLHGGAPVRDLVNPGPSPTIPLQNSGRKL